MYSAEITNQRYLISFFSSFFGIDVSQHGSYIQTIRMEHRIIEYRIRVWGPFPFFRSDWSERSLVFVFQHTKYRHTDYGTGHHRHWSSQLRQSVSHFPMKSAIPYYSFVVFCDRVAFMKCMSCRAHRIFDYEKGKRIKTLFGHLMIIHYVLSLQKKKKAIDVLERMRKLNTIITFIVRRFRFLFFNINVLSLNLENVNEWSMNE